MKPCKGAPGKAGRHLRRAMAATVVMALAGCAATTATPEQQVATLAHQRWQHLVGGEWQKAYNMLTPAYRQLHDLRHYQSGFSGAVQWKRAEVATVACEPERCEARIELTTASPFARRPGETISTFFTETWLLEEGRWYYHEKP